MLAPEIFPKKIVKRVKQVHLTNFFKMQQRIRKEIRVTDKFLFF